MAVLGSPRRYRTPPRYITPAARRLRSRRPRRRGLWARLSTAAWDYSWLGRQVLGALLVLLLGFAVLKSSSPLLSGIRQELIYYLTTDYDFRAATREVLSGELSRKMAENLKFLPDLWDRLRGGGTGEDAARDAVFIFPVPGGTVTSGFGYRPDPVTGEVAFHTGIDIAAPEGTPILAALGGEILFVDEDESYGKVVEIDHGEGMVTLYAHASEVTVEVGDIVDQGDEIAKVGMTGKATSPHCHFEVIVSGQPVDPMRMKGLSEGP
ncbi:MAG TPA: hypothetical protein DGR79_02800 [Clostridiales bacterium]|nr:hypothetical protein [Clostridiales bacterium]